MTLTDLLQDLRFFYGICVVQAVLGLLWVKDRIPPNDYLGFRTRSTLGDRQAWYEVHRLWGWTQLVSAAVGVLGLMLAESLLPPSDAYRAAFPILGIPLALSVLWSWLRTIGRGKAATQEGVAAGDAAHPATGEHHA